MKRKLFLGFVFFGLACVLLFIALPKNNNLPEEYGKELNSLRIEMGIPIIPADWEFFSTPDKRVWENHLWDKTDRFYGDGADPLRIHYQKVVVVLDANTVQETDIYLGDMLSVDDVENVVLEKVEIICTYRLDMSGVACATDLKTKDAIYSGENIERAQEVLNSWGLSYP